MFYKNGFPQSMQYTVEAEIFVEDLISLYLLAV